MNTIHKFVIPCSQMPALSLLGERPVRPDIPEPLVLLLRNQRPAPRPARRRPTPRPARLWCRVRSPCRKDRVGHWAAFSRILLVSRGLVGVTVPLEI